MDAISYSHVRRHLAETMGRVCDEHEPIIITRANAVSVVMISLEDFNSIQETGYLMHSLANAENLRASIKQYEEGKYHQRNIIEE